MIRCSNSRQGKRNYCIAHSNLIVYVIMDNQIAPVCTCADWGNILLWGRLEPVSTIARLDWWTGAVDWT